MRGWAGLDVGSRKSVLVVLDDRGQVVRRLSLDMTLAGHTELLSALSALARRRRDLLPVAVEDPNSLVTRCLAEARYPVIAVPPLEVARFRAGRAPAGAKSDRSDARVLADMIRLQPDAHRRVPNDSAELLALRAIARQYRARRVQRNALDRQLRAQTARFYPAATEALRRERRRRRDMHAALSVASSPTVALHMRAGRVSEALRAAGRTRAVPTAAAELLGELRTPFPRLPVLVELAHGEALADTIEVLRAVDASVERLKASMLARAGEHPLWPVVSSFPGLGQVLGAVMLAEIGDDPARFANARGLLSFAGVAPVTRQSGGTISVHRRRVRNRPLAMAAQDWIMPLLLNSPPAHALYDARRAAGDRHHAAARRMVGKYLRALHHCMRTGDSYDDSFMVIAMGGSKSDQEDKLPPASA